MTRTDAEEHRTVVWVSAGAASAVAAKLVLAQGPAVLAYTDPGSEDDDNARFLADLESWFGQKILRLRSDKYRDVDDVIERTRYIVGPKGARCTTELKRAVRFRFQRPTDRQVFGFTADEKDRAALVEENDPGIDWWWPLIEAGLSKEDTLAMVERAGMQTTAWAWPRVKRTPSAAQRSTTGVRATVPPLQPSAS